MHTNPSGGEFQRLSPGRFSFCFPFDSEGLRFETRFAQLLFLFFLRFGVSGIGLVSRGYVGARLFDIEE